MTHNKDENEHDDEDYNETEENTDSDDEELEDDDIEDEDEIEEDEDMEDETEDDDTEVVDVSDLDDDVLNTVFNYVKNLSKDLDCFVAVQSVYPTNNKLYCKFLIPRRYLKYEDLVVLTDLSDLDEIEVAPNGVRLSVTLQKKRTYHVKVE
jgi:hypothetical protein